MKKLLILSVLSANIIFAADSSTNTYASLPSKDRDAILNSIKQIEFARCNSSFFSGCSGARSQSGYISSQADRITKVLNKNLISYPSDLTYSWLNQLKDDLTKQPSPSSQQSTTCDVTGLNKADVLRVLYRNATSGRSWPSASKESFTQNDFEKAVSKELDFDYFGGRPLKVNLRGNILDTMLYDRDNGEGAAQKAISELRKQLSQ